MNKSAYSQDSTDTPLKTENYFKLDYDNDFFSATDRYYTQGIILTFIHPLVRYSPFSYTLIRLSKKALNYYGLHAEQDVFTPRSIRYNGGQIYYGERPFTAVFFVSHSLTSIHRERKFLLRTQLDLGILGPEAMGEEEQKGIHKALDNIAPQGWENQLSTDYIVNYRAKAEKGLLDREHISLLCGASARLGTLYTDLSLGLSARFGIYNPYFEGLGLERHTTKNRFKIYGFAGADCKLVGYNATLQGGLTNSGNIYELPDSSVSRLVYDLSLGMVIAYKRVSLEYSKTYISPEFEGGLAHSWGRCGLTLCF